MGDFPVTFYAATPFPDPPVHPYGGFEFGIYQQFLMTPDTVVLHHPGAGFQNTNYLPLHSQGEQGRVAQSVVGFKIILTENIVVRHMAIVAMGIFAMRTVVPGGILGRHDMAVDTSFRPVGKIEMGFPQIN